MSKVDNKKIKAYWSKKSSKQIIEEGEELIMRDEEFKEMKENELKEENKKGLLYYIKKHKVSFVAALAALGVTISVVGYHNNKSKEEITNDNELEEAINNYEIDPNEINVFENPISEVVEEPEVKKPLTGEETVEPDKKEEIEKTNEEKTDVNEEKLVQAPSNNINNTSKTTTQTKPIIKEESKTTDWIMDMPDIYYNPDIYYTNDSVLVTVMATEEIKASEGWTLSEDKMSMSKRYYENTIEMVTVNNLRGQNKTVEVNVWQIDRQFDLVSVSYEEIRYNQVLVTITSNEELQPLDGWTLSEDLKSLSRIYTKTTKEQVIIKDLAGNNQVVDINVKIKERSYSSNSSSSSGGGNSNPGGDPNPGGNDPKPGDNTNKDNTGVRDEDTIGSGGNTGITSGEEDDIVMSGMSLETTEASLVALYTLRQEIIDGKTFEYLRLDHYEETSTLKLTK